MSATSAMTSGSVIRARTTDVASTLAPLRHGRHDPTTWIRSHGRRSGSGEFVHATLTPDGPGTVRLTWRRDTVGVAVETFGHGGTWLRDRVPSMLGSGDSLDHQLESARHPAIAGPAHEHRGLCIGASANPYHQLLPTIIEQRITAGEAYRQWAALCSALGERAPGPFTGLRLPPRPEVLAQQPTWWFHPLGIERKRAQPLVSVARHASKLQRWADLGPIEAGHKLQLLPGIGPWTAATVLGSAWGDADAVPVGDYHFKNMVAWALAGEPRGSDERMLELLEPYAGQRGRVIRLLALGGHGAPKFGPRRRVLPMQRW